ncbi:MAG TPA: H-X9-DG-CTERM domain-containing protein, partial [Gemmataceae bacterium]|nr:H-X9-DG-CTERM domain-containing protein [Gemmataceae bacterium]
GDPRQPATIRNITDGTSNTIAVTEAKTAVPWTKPDDLPFNPNGPLPPLGGRFPSGFNAAFADGSVRLIPKDTPEATIKGYVTRNGGEIVPPP